MMKDDEMIAVIQAHKEGKRIEYKLFNVHDDWKVAGTPAWNFEQRIYRVATPSIKQQEPNPKKDTGGWLPIETAPKKGVFLVLGKKESNGRRGEIFDRADPHCSISHFTHWAQIPALPDSVKPKKLQRIVCSAVKLPNGTLLVAPIGVDIPTDRKTFLFQEGCADGFLDQNGVFLNRFEAYEVALAAGQIKEKFYNRALFNEDLR